jgi:glutamate formiminotransferase/glutamate formiminotransferase/formiminotetrahydrofolate cyclodeaminase
VLLSAPNVSEGTDAEAIEAIGAAFTSTGDGTLLNVHSDPDHNRSVFTLAGEAGRLSQALLAGAREAVARIDLTRHAGIHPHIGALDVVPLVHLTDDTRGQACAEALVTGDIIGRELHLPVLLYGALGDGRTRAELRRGGPAALAARIDSGELRPDFGPVQHHRTAGATLLSARPPLVAFNLELAPPATLETAKEIAAAIREGEPEGLPGLRAIGLWLEHANAAQVSFNVEDPRATPLAAVVEATRRHAPVARAELVGLAPKQAFESFPEDIPIPGFDPARHIIENAIQQLGL